MSDTIRVEDDELRGAELSRDEWDREVESQMKRLLDMTVSDFCEAMEVGKIDRDDWRVEYLSGLIH